MPSLTVTITDATKGPFSLAKLFAGGTIQGATLKPTTPGKVPQKPQYISIQADPANTTNFIMVGDSTILTDNSSQGKRLANSAVDIISGACTPALSQRFVNGVNNTIINIEVY